MTAIVVLSVPSEIVSVPVLEPVVTTTVAAVVDVIACDTLVTPLTPLIENTVVPETQFVPEPLSVIVMFPAWPFGIAGGEAAIDGAEVQVIEPDCPVLVSVIVAVPEVVPVVSENVAAVLLVTVMPEMFAPDRPDNENSVLAVSCVQTVFDPVAVIVIVVFS